MGLAGKLAWEAAKIAMKKVAESEAARNMAEKALDTVLQSPAVQDAADKAKQMIAARSGDEHGQEEAPCGGEALPPCNAPQPREASDADAADRLSVGEPVQARAEEPAAAENAVLPPTGQCGGEAAIVPAACGSDEMAPASGSGEKPGLRDRIKRTLDTVLESQAVHNAKDKVLNSEFLQEAKEKALEKADGAAGYGTNAALAALLRFANTKIERYGERKGLRRDEEGYHAVLQLLGSAEYLEVTMLGLELNEDCSVARLGPFAANAVWLDNLLEDYARGREVPIPEGPVRSVLSRLPKRWLNC